MNGLKPVSIISLLQIGFITVGYLATELCITARYGRGPHVHYPRVVQHATGYWWVFMAATVVWAAYALLAQEKSGRRIFSTYLPLGTGLALLLFTFVFYLQAVAVAAAGPLLHLR